MIRIGGDEWNLPNISYIESIKYYQTIHHNQSSIFSYWSEYNTGELRINLK